MNKEVVRAGLALLSLCPISEAQVVTEIIDAWGDGSGVFLTSARKIAADGAGNVFVASSDRVFKVEPTGAITQVLDPSGDGNGNTYEYVLDLEVDLEGNLYAVALNTSNIFRVTPAGVVEEYYDHFPYQPSSIAIEAAGTAIVAIFQWNLVFRVEADGTESLLLDASGDGLGNAMDRPYDVAVDGAGNVFVSAYYTDNLFRIAPDGIVTEVMDATGDGAGAALDGPWSVEVGPAGDVYVAGQLSRNVLRLSPGGVVTQILDASGDGAGNALDQPVGLAVAETGEVYVAGNHSDNVFEIATDGTVTQVIDGQGDGMGNPLDQATDVAASLGRVYVSGDDSKNALALGPEVCEPATGSELNYSLQCTSISGAVGFLGALGGSLDAIKDGDEGTFLEFQPTGFPGYYECEVTLDLGHIAPAITRFELVHQLYGTGGGQWSVALEVDGSWQTVASGGVTIGHVFGPLTTALPIPPACDVTGIRLMGTGGGGNLTDATYRIFELRAFGPGAAPYCEGKPNSQGCTASIDISGTPSASSPSPCWIICSDVVNNKNGLLFYGFGSSDLPLLGGTLCVQAPLVRTAVQASGGNPPPADCSGSFAYDFNAWIQSGADSALVPCTRVFAQYWYRDPADPTGFASGLSNALELEIGF